MAEQCPFCQLVDNPDQLLKVHESDHFIAFLDINPRARGHTMIISKDHYDDLLDLPKNLVGEAFTVAHTVAEKVTNGLSAKGVSLIVNSGEIAGQRVPHLYIQIFPRFANEETSEAPAGAIFKPIEAEESELKQYQDKIKSANHTQAQKKIKKAEDRAGLNDEEEESDQQETNEERGSDFEEESVEFT